MKIGSIFCLVFLALAIFCFAFYAKAETTNIQAVIAQLEAQINQLLKQIAQLKSQIAANNPSTTTTTTPVPENWCYTFNANIGTGQKTGNPDVEALKIALQKMGLYNSAASTGSGYDEALMMAVAKFQEKYASEILTPYKLKKATGFFGKVTRAKLNKLYGCSKTEETTKKSEETTPPPACTENNWTYALSPSTCPSSGQQTKKWSLIGTCSGGVSHSSAETISCSSQETTCTSFTYTYWSTCNSSGVQTRTITSSLPSGCTGGNPVTSQTCTYTPECTENNWTYVLSPTTCPYSGTQTKTWTKVGTCSSGISHPSTETVNCTYQANICNSFTYSNWSTCNSSGVQTRTITSSLPSGCTGGNPVTSQTCTYTPTVSSPNWTCTAWSACSNVWGWGGQQTRTCTDTNNLGITTGKPIETHACGTVDFKANNSSNYLVAAPGTPINLTWVASKAYKDVSPTDCSTREISASNSIISSSSVSASGSKTISAPSTATMYDLTCHYQYSDSGSSVNDGVIVAPTWCYPNWQCGGWSSCSSGFQQERTCTDSNNCGNSFLKPNERQSCTSPCSEGTCGVATVDIKADNSEKFTVDSGKIPVDGITGEFRVFWASTNVASCTASGDWSGSKSPSGGAEIVSPVIGVPPNYKTYTYTITCVAQQGGTVTDSLVVTPIMSPMAAVLVDYGDDYVASTGHVNYDTSINLKWNTIEATRCTAGGNWSGSKAMSGSQTVTVAAGSNAGSYSDGYPRVNYYLTCDRGYGGSSLFGVVPASIDLTTKPKVDLKVNGSDGPVAVIAGSTINIAWKSKNATKCEAWSMGLGFDEEVPLSGSMTLSVPQSWALGTSQIFINCGSPTGNQTITSSNFWMRDLIEIRIYEPQ